MWQKFDVYKIVAYKDGCVFKTKKMTTIWRNFDKEQRTDAELAAAHNGDILSPTGECFFGKEPPYA